AYFVTGRGTMRTINIGTPPKPSFLGRNRIDDHLSHCCHAGGIQPSNEQERDVIPLIDRAKTLEITVQLRARNLRREITEGCNLGIDRSFVAAVDRSAR